MILVADASVASWERIIVNPCGHELEGGDVTAFYGRVPAPDPAVLRRCAADRALVEEARKVINRRVRGVHPQTRVVHAHEVSVWHTVLKGLAAGYGLTDHQEGE